MNNAISRWRLSFAGAALGALYLAACSGAPTEGDPELGVDPGAVSGSCSLSLTKNTYSDYWGTITVKNNGSSSASGYVVEFDVPSGVHCTNDEVPSGAKLSPLNGSGSSAHT